MKDAITLLKTRKILSLLRDSRSLGGLWSRTERELDADSKDDRSDLRHHFEVCTRVQQIFDEIEKLSAAIPSIRADRQVFRIRALRKVELQRRALHSAAERVDSDALSQIDVSEIGVIFDNQQRQLCDAVNILISANSLSSTPGIAAVDDQELEKLLSLANSYDLIQGMFDEYSYNNVAISVHHHSTVFGPLYSDQFSLASHWASLRIFSDDRVTDLRFRSSLSALIDQYSNMERRHETLEGFLGSSCALSDIVEILEPRLKRQERELSDYLDLGGEIGGKTRGETLGQCLRAWNCLYAIALAARAWAEVRDQEEYAHDPVPMISESFMVEFIQARTGAHADLARRLLARFSSEDTGRADLFLRPLLQSGSGMFTLPVTHIETSRMDRNILSIANLEGKLDQSQKGKKATSLLKNKFQSAGFETICDFPILANGSQKTDLDIAAMKDGVLFLGQSKVVIRPDSPYEHWKIHQKLIVAADQMRASLTHLQSNLPKLLRRLECSTPPRAVVPFLLTSAWEFTGTEIEGYPVVDFSYLAMLLEGAEIALLQQEPDGRVHCSVRRMICGRWPTAGELRAMIEDPLHRAMFRRPPNSRLGLVQIGQFKVHLPCRNVEPNLRRPANE